MFLFQANDIYDTARPLHACSQLIGLTSFSVKKVLGKFVVCLNLFNILCIVLSSILTISISVFYTIIKNDLYEDEITEISDAFENSILAVTFVYMMVLLLQNWWFFLARKYFADILNSLKEFDDNLKVRLNFQSHRKIVLTSVCSIKTVIVLVTFAAFTHDDTVSDYLVGQPVWKHFFFALTIMITIELNIFLTLQFTFWMWSVKLRYQKLNDFIRENFLSTREENEKNGNDNLQKAAFLHDKLVDVTKYINICYGVPVRFVRKTELVCIKIYSQLMVSTAINFASLTLGVYGTSKLLLQGGPSTVAKSIDNLLWIIIYCLISYGYIHMGHFTKLEV